MFNDCVMFDDWPDDLCLHNDCVQVNRAIHRGTTSNTLLCLNELDLLLHLLVFIVSCINWSCFPCFTCRSPVSSHLLNKSVGTSSFSSNVPLGQKLYNIIRHAGISLQSCTICSYCNISFRLWLMRCWQWLYCQHCFLFFFTLIGTSLTLWLFWSLFKLVKYLFVPWLENPLGQFYSWEAWRQSFLNCCHMLLAIHILD
jgi:hypothetical protein